MLKRRKNPPSLLDSLPPFGAMPTDTFMCHRDEIRTNRGTIASLCALDYVTAAPTDHFDGMGLCER